MMKQNLFLRGEKKMFILESNKCNVDGRSDRRICKRNCAFERTQYNNVIANLKIISTMYLGTSGVIVIDGFIIAGFHLLEVSIIRCIFPLLLLLGSVCYGARVYFSPQRM